jgi:hypothetical protein
MRLLLISILVLSCAHTEHTTTPRIYDCGDPNVPIGALCTVKSDDWRPCPPSAKCITHQN